MVRMLHTLVSADASPALDTVPAASVVTAGNRGFTAWRHEVNRPIDASVNRHPLQSNARRGALIPEPLDLLASLASLMDAS